MSYAVKVLGEKGGFVTKFKRTLWPVLTANGLYTTKARARAVGREYQLAGREVDIQEVKLGDPVTVATMAPEFGAPTGFILPVLHDSAGPYLEHNGHIFRRWYGSSDDVLVGVTRVWVHKRYANQGAKFTRGFYASSVDGPTPDNEFMLKEARHSALNSLRTANTSSNVGWVPLRTIPEGRDVMTWRAVGTTNVYAPLTFDDLELGITQLDESGERFAACYTVKSDYVPKVIATQPTDALV